MAIKDQIPWDFMIYSSNPVGFKDQIPQDFGIYDLDLAGFRIHSSDLMGFTAWTPQDLRHRSWRILGCMAQIPQDFGIYSTDPSGFRDLWRGSRKIYSSDSAEFRDLWLRSHGMSGFMGAWNSVWNFNAIPRWPPGSSGNVTW